MGGWGGRTRALAAARRGMEKCLARTGAVRRTGARSCPAAAALRDLKRGRMVHSRRADAPGAARAGEGGDPEYSGALLSRDAMRADTGGAMVLLVLAAVGAEWGAEAACEPASP